MRKALAEREKPTGFSRGSVTYQIGELNVSEIARRVGADYKSTVKHLEILEDEGILKHKAFGRIRLYRFDEASAKAQALKKFFEEWESIKKL